ncbi:unnamed protein product [Effrenium voratum]|nr:unnamed protein product [Effrenium voratum]
MALINVRFISGESLGKFRLEPSDSVETLRALGESKLALDQCIQSLLLKEEVVTGRLEALNLEEEPVFVAVLGERRPETYLVHDNGGRPFKVKVLRKGEAAPGKVWVYMLKSSEEELKYEDSPILEETVERIFVGTSPKHGKVFDGNSLLLKKSKNQYIFVGGNIFSFESEAEISRYSSPVGNSDVPYPFAVDTEGRNYLLINNVVLNTVPEGKDPYEHFYFSVRCQKIDWQLQWKDRAMSFPTDAAETYHRFSTIEAEACFSVRKGDSVEEIQTEARFAEVVQQWARELGVAFLKEKAELVEGVC